MKALNEEEWKAFQEKVKNLDKQQSLLICPLYQLGVNIFVATLTISKKDYSEVLF